MNIWKFAARGVALALASPGARRSPFTLPGNKGRSITDYFWSTQIV